MIESGGQAITVDDSEILPALTEVARVGGLFVEPSAATTWACLKKAVAEKTIQPEEKVVCLFTGNGLKDVNRAREAAGEPKVIDAKLDDAQKALDELLS